jgi:ankyrin repeat protein
VRWALGVVAALAAATTVGCDDEARPDPTRDAALIEAAAAGNRDDVERLLEGGASVDAVDATGRTALVAAAYGNHVEVARLLVEAGADVNRQDESQQSAFLIATSEVGDDPRLLELTLANGADVDAKDSYNGTGLIRAADRGYVRIVRRLLETEIDVDHVNRLGWTALLEAVILGGGDAVHTDVVRILVEEGGVDVDIADGSGKAALDHARENGYDEMISILEAGAPS